MIDRFVPPVDSRLATAVSPDRPLAVFGATSHIAKGLIERLARAGAPAVHLFSRSPERVRTFVTTVTGVVPTGWQVHAGYDAFATHQYGVVVNCVGVGTMRDGRGVPADYFFVTEQFDNLALAHLRQTNQEALYISFSSGAVYGRTFAVPADGATIHPVVVNGVTAADYYGIARLYAEAKHRALAPLRVIDLRLFSYFSRHIDLRDGYLVTDLVGCCLRGEPFVVTGDEIVRDYLHPNDLYEVLLCCLGQAHINGAFDVVSAAPARKSEIVRYFVEHHGLVVHEREGPAPASPTGDKACYHSTARMVERLGFRPRHTTLDTLRDETPPLLVRERENCRR